MKRDIFLIHRSKYLVSYVNGYCVCQVEDYPRKCRRSVRSKTKKLERRYVRRILNRRIEVE